MKRVYSFSKEDLQQVKDLTTFDPYAQSLPPEKLEELKKDPLFDVIFARQGVEIREGSAFELGVDYILIVDAPEGFFKLGEEKLKRIKSVKRLNEKDEAKVIEKIEEQSEKAEIGFGSIFG